MHAIVSGELYVYRRQLKWRQVLAVERRQRNGVRAQAEVQESGRNSVYRSEGTRDVGQLGMQSRTRTCQPSSALPVEPADAAATSASRAQYAATSASSLSWRMRSSAGAAEYMAAMAMPAASGDGG